MNKIFF